MIQAEQAALVQELNLQLIAIRQLELGYFVAIYNK